VFTWHIENDEVILQVLADKVSKNFSDYSLQDTEILKQLPKVVYDKPLFHHPPLFIYGLILFKILFGTKFLILFPILASTLVVWVVFLIAKQLYDEKVGLVAAAIFGLCPIVMHASTKIWIDALLTLFCALTIYLSVLAVKKDKFIWYVLAGISCGLAVLSKISALPILAPVFYLFMKKPRSINKIIKVALFLISAILVTSPWFVAFYRTFGTIFPWWIRPSAEPLHMFPFIRMALDRPFYFYFLNISIVTPIYIYSWVDIIRKAKKPSMWLEPIWALAFILSFTIVGIRGLEGYVTRYILPAIPALAILSANFLVEKNKKLFWIIAAIFLAYGLTVAILNAFLAQVADVFSLFYFLSLLK
jgi:4-amino-4-deoxy-L-arabinose transferase-like glycosyltransferase